MGIGVKMDEKDNVAVVISNAAPGEVINISPGLQVKAIDNIPKGHKIATDFIEKGKPVVKYATDIGIAGSDIPIGAHVHTQNVADIING